MGRLILKKAIVREKIDASTYKVEDLLTKEEMQMIIKGKLRMNYFVLPIGVSVYLVVSSSNPKLGSYIFEKYIYYEKPAHELVKQKKKLDEKIEKIKEG